jgi:hypothetical protein
MEKLFFNVTAFDWDQWNAEKIRGAHQVEPYECEEIFFNEVLFVPDDRHSANERRYHALGMTNAARLLFVVFTVRGEKVRVISARDMHKKERKIYYEEIKKNSRV